ncbi:MAG: sugar ABC transporter ATP-binding protein [Lachnospiraceae bacterium]|nr:sugar ABC transporter ATP-binding protein [Lachnospiraceae bacterium]
MGVENVIELKNITKDFFGVRALDNVSISIRPGRVHALLGENGAGKSTLMKILNGTYQPDKGQIFVEGKETTVADTIDARKKGIAMIYQELNYISELSIEENVFMGRFPTGKIPGTVDWKEVRRQTRVFLENEGLDYDPGMKIKNLSVSEIQMLEIMKAISFDAKVIIMDEPTSSITTREVALLFKRIRELKQRGIAIVYISHKLDEIFEIADDVTVLRDGVVVDHDLINQYTSEKLITQMVGREIKNVYPKEQVPIGEVRFRIENFSRENIFHHVGLTVKKGEILGIAGLVGAGRTELARSVVGLDSRDDGDIYLDGQKVEEKSVFGTMKQGIVMVSEDRREYGIIGCRNLIENATLADNLLQKGIIAGTKPQVKRAKELIKGLNVKASSVNVNIENLSGGNQQKVVLCKWLMANAKVLILDEPTRGIDVGAKYEIYKIIGQLAGQGCAIIVISSEIPELMGIADRIQVMCRGKLSPSIQREDFSQELIMKYAVGGIKSECENEEN